MVELVEIIREDGWEAKSQVFVNPEHITMIERNYKQKAVITFSNGETISTAYSMSEIMDVLCLPGLVKEFSKDYSQWRSLNEDHQDDSK